MHIETLLKFLNEYKNPSNCEYLVFRSDGRGIYTDFSAEERAKIYEIITILPFPANTNPLYAARIEELSSNIPYSLDTQEKLVIETALKQVSEDLYALPIPKSLIGFYIFGTIQIASPYNEKIDIDKFAIGGCSAKAVAAAKNYIRDVMPLLDPKNIERVKAGHTNVFKFLDFLAPYLTAKSFADLNNSRGFDQLWHGVNASLIEEVSSSSATDLKSMFSLFISTWINDAIKGYEGGIIFGTGFLLSLNEIKKGGLNKLLSLELDIAFSSEFENMCVLYRGARGGVNGDLAYLLRSPTNSFSYGNGLLDGLILSAGDCAFEYMCQGGTIVGIAVFVNIANYRRNLQERKLFFIPPLSIISRLLSGQDTSHPKTLGRQLFNSFEESIVPEDMLGLVRAGKVQANLVPYLQEHALTIYDPNNINFVPQLRSLKLTPTILPEANGEVANKCGLTAEKVAKQSFKFG